MNQIKLENIVLEEPMRIALNVNGCNKLGQNRFDNIVAMKINVTLEFRTAYKQPTSSFLVTLLK